MYFEACICKPGDYESVITIITDNPNTSVDSYNSNAYFYVL